MSKTKNTVEITNVPSDKEIFTARTEEGFVACFRLDKGIFFSSEVFSKPLVAANAARRLRKEFTASTSPVLPHEVEVVIRADEDKQETTSNHYSKKVSCFSKLYDKEEVDSMPLVTFEEVWVITRYEDFVSDCLNHEKKRLVAYCPTKDTAKPFGDHEEAKRVMRVLKGTVGPGFDLKRFFVRVD